MHFALLGAALFALYAAVSGSHSAASDEIVVTRGQVASLSAGFERSWNRAPTDKELAALVDAWVRDEVLYREGVALGLDRDDVVVRKRVAQKLEVLTEGAADAAPPSDSELERWLAEHAASYTLPAVVSFEQVYFDPKRRGRSLERDVERARRSARPAELGDATLLPPRLEGASPREVESRFGQELARAVESLPVGEWSGPVTSSYGAHLVRVTARTEARTPALAEVRDDVARDWQDARARAAQDALYERLRAKYRVTVESLAIAGR